ncbi:Zn(2)-C6 fungal-type transcription factor afumD [Fulvia fulva]|nr:Zn(2)-C6 fungal-type transcription factor afumD [Fulvia fulva]KAK4609660.1 Zn(2)-C6 fungal-type transcription factor afumD [Fulvia fulva]WPV37794.1 Zn(2)-C6 fungal-type transcription factor afumD [Fulvia fulva]
MDRIGSGSEATANGALHEHSAQDSQHSHGSARSHGSQSSRTPTPARESKKPRAPHTKSRQGCLRCKRRRVKCNEQRPKCRACQIRNESCKYPDLVACSTCLRTDCICFNDPIPPAQQRADDSAVDFEFIYHYGRFTYDTVAVEPITENAKPLFQPPACLQHPFLMDLFMALAATHLATSNPAEASKYIVHAIRYQNRAFGRFSGVLVDPKVEDCLPMFLFSAMLGILQLALSRVPRPTDQSQSIPPIETLLELRRLWRGSKSILQHSRGIMSSENYQSIFDDDEAPRREHLKTPVSDKDLQGECYGPLNDLLNLVDATFPADSTSFPIPIQEIDPAAVSDDEACKLAVAWLRRITGLHLSSRPAQLLAWPVVIPEKFLHLVQAENPRAQAICACYGFLLRRLNDRWWAHGFGQDLILQLASPRNRAIYAEFYRRLFESAMTDG